MKLMSAETYCICCGDSWGNEESIGSSGVCPSCFGEWVNKKRKSQDQTTCYGEFGLHIENGCNTCFVSNLCEKDSYGI
jgi:hypothetical protein